MSMSVMDRGGHPEFKFQPVKLWFNIKKTRNCDVLELLLERQAHGDLQHWETPLLHQSSYLIAQLTSFFAVMPAYTTYGVFFHVKTWKGFVQTKAGTLTAQSWEAGSFLTQPTKRSQTFKKKKGKTQDKGWNLFFTMGWDNKSDLFCVSVYIKELLGFMPCHI